jgi:hypothetical protein
MQGTLGRLLTSWVLLLEAVNRGPLGFGLEQQQEHRFKDARHIPEGESAHQPALGRGTDGTIRAGQAVQHNKQGPVGGKTPLSPCSATPVCRALSYTLGMWCQAPWTPQKASLSWAYRCKQTTVRDSPPWFLIRTMRELLKPQCPRFTPNWLHVTLAGGRVWNLS